PLIISPIISDTLLFKSPTSTKQHLHPPQPLKHIPNLHLQPYALQILKPPASTTHKSPQTLLNIDPKSFNIPHYLTPIAQLNTLHIHQLLHPKDQFQKLILQITPNQKYHLFLLLLTHIINTHSKILLLPPQKHKLPQPFKLQLHHPIAFLSG
ncbi:DHHA2 domain-containing protein, partial [Staphylococcus epidermidis]|uniref:DHHA2 domain-containing protein n=1 Tax=Staphylococcus epidermidis TaxID=1282 RepID=UPI0037D9C389